MSAEEKKLDHLNPGAERVQYKKTAPYICICMGNLARDIDWLSDLGGKRYMHAYTARVVSGYSFYL